MDKPERVARAICAEKCAFMGEPPCYTVEGEWPNPNCSEPGCHAEAQAAIAALEPMDKPRVKPLAWKLDDNRTAYAQRQYFADRYCIEHRLHGDDVFDLWIGPDAVKATRHATLEAAKAAAQADYEARILAAIEPAPVSVREAARVLCGSTETPFLEPASAITKGLKNHGYLVPVRILHKELRAIAEGKE